MISYAAIGGKSKVVNFVTFSSSMSFDKTVRISTGERKTFSDLVSGSSYYNTLDVRVWINGMTSYDQDLSYSVTAD